MALGYQEYFVKRKLPGGASSTLRGTISYSYTDTKNGVSNPKWKSQVANHQNATTAYARDITNRKVVSACNMQYIKNGNSLQNIGQTTQVTITGDILPHFNPNLMSIGNLAQSTVLEFLKKAKRKQSDTSLGVALGELRETVHAFKHPIESLKKGFLDYSEAVVRNSKRAARVASRRPRLPSNIDVDLVDRGLLVLGKKRKRPVPSVYHRRRDAIADAITGTYLEAANGWRPLAAEVESLAHSLARYNLENGVTFKKVGASVSMKAPSSQVTGSLDYIEEIEYRTIRTLEQEASCLITGELSYTVGQQSPYQSLGLGWLDFGATLWELMPLSYVGDWFFPIGDLLEATAFDQSTLTWTRQTVRYKSVYKLSGKNQTPLNPTVPGGIQSTAGTLGVTNVVRTGLTRSVPNLSVLPLVRLRLPESFLISKLCNVLSLSWAFRNSSRQINRLLNG